jgi:hypothetical protein
MICFDQRWSSLHVTGEITGPGHRNKYTFLEPAKQNKNFCGAIEVFFQLSCEPT